MTKELAIEAKHAVVLVPLDEKRPAAATGPPYVYYTGIGNENDFPTLEFEAHAPVKIFTMEKVILVPQADIIHCFALD